MEATRRRPKLRRERLKAAIAQALKDKLPYEWQSRTAKKFNVSRQRVSQIVLELAEDNLVNRIPRSESPKEEYLPFGPQLILLRLKYRLKRKSFAEVLGTTEVKIYQAERRNSLRWKKQEVSDFLCNARKNHPKLAEELEQIFESIKNPVEVN